MPAALRPRALEPAEPVEADELAPWPGAGEEAAFLAQPAASGGAADPSELAPLAVAAPSPAPPLPGADLPLPSLDQLVARIPAPVRQTLDELFRAKFVGVRRFPTPTRRG